MRLRCGRVGIAGWDLDRQPAAAARDAAAELEGLGYGALWPTELKWREAFSNAAILLSATTSMVVATGVASMYARSAHTTQAGWKTLSEAFPGRYVLGVGVGHAAFVEAYHQVPWQPQSFASLVRYLDQIDAGRFAGAAPGEEPVRVIAALGPRMLRLARDRSAGALTNCTTVEHTAQARSILGPEAFLGVSLIAGISADPARGRALGRQYVGDLSLPHYRDNLTRLGWKEADLAPVSDRLVDALVAHGSPEQIVDRVREHLAAGADHVCVSLQTEEPTELPMTEWKQIAAAAEDLMVSR